MTRTAAVSAGRGWRSVPDDEQPITATLIENAPGSLIAKRGTDLIAALKHRQKGDAVSFPEDSEVALGTANVSRQNHGQTLNSEQRGIAVREKSPPSWAAIVQHLGVYQTWSGSLNCPVLFFIRPPSVRKWLIEQSWRQRS